MTGGGDSENFTKIDAHFLSLLSEDPTLLFIPLAGEPESFTDCHERIKETFSTIEFENIEMCLDLKDLKWSHLKNFDALYIDGGNTFKLMKHIRESHFYELLRMFIHNGGIINGDSAGAIILGSHLETAHFGTIGDENLSGLISYQGLNLLGDWVIHCHYDLTDDFEIKTFTRQVGLPVLALAEDTAIAVEDGQINVFGPGMLKVFQNNKSFTILPGESFIYG